jgi:hypothetical protein
MFARIGRRIADSRNHADEPAAQGRDTALAQGQR